MMLVVKKLAWSPAEEKSSVLLFLQLVCSEAWKLPSNLYTQVSGSLFILQNVLVSS